MILLHGWFTRGSTHQPVPSSLLALQVQLTLRGYSVCKRYMPRERWARNSMICAGNPEARRRKDTCSGDSGSPLLLRTTKGRRGWDLQASAGCSSE